MEQKVVKGDRFTNYLGKVCVVKSIYKNIIKLQVLDEDDNPYTEVWDMKDFLKNKSFLKIPMPKINRANISKYLLEFQLNMIGKTLYEAKHTPEWFNEWTITQEQFNYFESYAIPLLKKTFKFNTTKAIDTFNWFNIQFGLKIK